MDTMMIMEMEIMKNKSPLWALQTVDKMVSGAIP